MDPFSIEVAYNESSNLSPLFFVLFPGTDPTPELDRALEVIEEFSHESFRSVLSSEPPSAPGVPLDLVMLIEIVPEATLQRCIKIADEAPADLKSNLRRAYGKFSPEDIERCNKQKEYKGIVFSLCFFHSLIVGRRRFGNQGYSKTYPFNDGDLRICGAVFATTSTCMKTYPT